MRAIALVDLDDTVFQTLGKCPEDVPRETLVPLGYARDGSALSFATPRQMNFLSWLSETARLVPVTARSRDALDRVRIKWSSAICAHGGVIVGSDGAADRPWAERMAAEACRHRFDLDRLLDRVRGEAGGAREAISARILEEGGTALYLLIKHSKSNSDALHSIIDALLPEVPEGWTVHRNGNNAALMPPFLGKQHAVAYLLPALRAAHPSAPVIGVGDSLTDAPFMALCDFAMMPSRSQLAAATLLNGA